MNLTKSFSWIFKRDFQRISIRHLWINSKRIFQRFFPWILPRAPLDISSWVFQRVSSEIHKEIPTVFHAKVSSMISTEASRKRNPQIPLEMFLEMLAEFSHVISSQILPMIPPGIPASVSPIILDGIYPEAGRFSMDHSGISLRFFSSDSFRTPLGILPGMFLRIFTKKSFSDSSENFC